ncbi:divalent-cation tolerance protein CutA [Calidifontibacter terrae]
MVELVEIRVSVPTTGLARDIAEALVGERLAACVQVIPEVQSTYAWEGGLEQSQESVITVKTTADRFDAVAARVRDMHPDEVPQVVAMAIVQVDAAYAAWLVSVLDD